MPPEAVPFNAMIQVQDILVEARKLVQEMKLEAKEEKRIFSLLGNQHIAKAVESLRDFGDFGNLSAQDYAAILMKSLFVGIDFIAVFQEQPTKAQCRDRAKKHVKNLDALLNDQSTFVWLCFYLHPETKEHLKNMRDWLADFVRPLQAGAPSQPVSNWIVWEVDGILESHGCPKGDFVGHLLRALIPEARKKIKVEGEEPWSNETIDLIRKKRPPEIRTSPNHTLHLLCSLSRLFPR